MARAIPLPMDVAGCPLPDDRLYDLENEVWWHWEGDSGEATVGVIAALGAFAGRFHAAQYRAVEGIIERGRSVATIESTRFTGAVRLPVDAVVLARNPAILERPRLLNDAPYEGGWVVRVRPRDRQDVERHLRTSAETRPALLRQIEERHIRCYPATPDSELYEIGVECSAVLAQLDDEIARRAPGEVVLLVTDDPTSPIEMVRWTDRTGHPVLDQRREGTLWHFLVRREANPQPRRPRR
jgi:glycine cleavage system H protein